MLLWIVKYVSTRIGLPRNRSTVTAAAATNATSSRYAAVSGREYGATTAVAGTGEASSAGMPGTAGRSGMSLGIGAVMTSR